MIASLPEAGLAQLLEALGSSDEPTRQAACDELVKHCHSNAVVDQIAPSLAASRERIVIGMLELHAQAIDALPPRTLGRRRWSHSSQRWKWRASLLERMSRRLAINVGELAPLLTSRILALPSLHPHAGLAARLLVSVGEGARAAAPLLMKILRRDGDSEGRVGIPRSVPDHVGIALGRLARTDAALLGQLLALLESGARSAAGALGAAGPAAREATPLLKDWVGADTVLDLRRVLEAATALADVAPEESSWGDALVRAWPVACDVADRGGPDHRAAMLWLLHRLGDESRLVSIEAAWRRHVQTKREVETPRTPPRDERPSERSCMDLVSPDEAVRVRVALELECRISGRVHALMDRGVPEERVQRQLLEEMRRDLTRLTPSAAPRLVRLAAEHDDHAGPLPFTGDDAYVRCVGTIIAAWGPLAQVARDVLHSLETHESARLRNLAQEGLRAIGE